jgi:hypothetical protein
LALVAGTLLMGFKNSKLVFSWSNPAYTGGKFKNVLVLAMNGKATSRADFEDRMVSAILRPGIQAVQSYSLLPRPEATPIDMNDLRDVVRGQKFDSILVSRMVKYKKTVTYTPGEAYPLYPYYSTFYGYYGEVGPVVYSPDYLQTDTKIQIETNFYAAVAPDGQLVWTGTSDTINAGSVKSTIDGVVRVVVQALQNQNVI